MTNLTDLLPAGAGGKQVSFTADGSISQGNAVALTSAGKAKAISSTGNPATVPNGSVTDVTTSMNGGGVNQKIEFDPHNSNRVIATSIDGNGYQRLTVGNYSGNTVTWGTPVVLLSDYIGQSSPFTFDPVNENEIVIVLKETGNDYRLVPATISGTSITLGVKNQFHSTSAIKVTGGMIAMDPSSSTRQGVIVFVSSDGFGNFYDMAFTVSGTGGSATITKGSVTNVASGYDSADYTSVVFNSSGTFIINGEGSGSNRVFAYAGTLSTTTITRGSITPLTGVSGTATSAIAVDPADATKIILAYYVSSSSSKIAVGTLSGTGNRTITWATAQDLTTTKQYLNVCIAFNPAKTDGTFVIAFTNSTDANVEAILANYSGTTITLGSATQLDSLNNDQIWCDFDHTSGLFAVIYKNTDTNQKISVIQGSDTSSNVADFIGIADAAISDTASGNITIKGGIASNGLSSLTPGSTYYVQSNGSLSTVSSSVTAGKALSATSINLDYSS